MDKFITECLITYNDFVTLAGPDSIRYILNRLFPANTKHKIATYVLGIYHLLGASLIIHSLMFKPDYLYLPIFLGIFILFTYYIFEDKCYVTMLTDFLSEQEGNTLVIPLSRGKKFFYFNLIMCVFIYIFPQLSPYNILKWLWNR